MGRTPRMGILVAVAIAVASAFAVAGPAGADHVPAPAAGEPNEPYFTCQASTARVTLLNGDPIPPVDPLGANLEREECAEDTGGLPDIALPPPPATDPAVETTTAQARTQIFCANDDPNTTTDDEACDAGRPSFEQQVLSTANVTDTTIRLGPLTIVAEAANTSARASCDPATNRPRLSSTSQVLNLNIGGSPVPIPLVTGEPNQVIEIPGLVRITLNELVGTQGAFTGNAEDATFADDAEEGFVTRRAIHIEVLPGLQETLPGNAADVVVAESTADFHGDVCPEGTIVVKKETAPDEPDNTTDFDFTAPGLLLEPSFPLADDGTRTFEEVQPGQYVISENAPTTGGYILTAINCVENRTDQPPSRTESNVTQRTATVRVSPGETVTCTFINAKPPTNVCPDNSTPNNQGQCVLEPVCPAGSTKNQQGQCVVDVPNCPTGSTRPDPNGPCVVTTPQCPTGSTPNGQGQCIINTANCPAGSTRPDPNGPCVVTTPNCPAGSTPSGNQCINNTISCPPGSTSVGNQCVVNQPNCPPGSARNPQGQCVVQNVQCPAGTVFNPTTLGCAEGPRGGTLVPIDQRVRNFFRGSPCVGQGFGPLVGIIGTNGPDRITGTNNSDRIFALGGNDRVSGGRGDDCMEGGSGNDVLDGSNGNDFLLGGTGTDRMEGGPGNDRFSGNSGRDVLSGGQGNDRFTGGSGNDRMNGGYGNDVIRGGSGNDGITNGHGRDRISGGTGNDTINVAIVGPKARVDCGPGRKDRVRISPGRHRDIIRRCEFLYIQKRTGDGGRARR